MNSYFKLSSDSSRKPAALKWRRANIRKNAEGGREVAREAETRRFGDAEKGYQASFEWEYAESEKHSRYVAIARDGRTYRGMRANRSQKIITSDPR